MELFCIFNFDMIEAGIVPSISINNKYTVVEPKFVFDGLGNFVKRNIEFQEVAHLMTVSRDPETGYATIRKGNECEGIIERQAISLFGFLRHVSFFRGYIKEATVYIDNFFISKKTKENERLLNMINTEIKEFVSKECHIVFIENKNMENINLDLFLK